MTDPPNAADPAARLKAARERTGLDREEVAGRLGVTYESVWDLEAFPDEIAMTLSLAEVVALARLVGVAPLALLTDVEPDASQRMPMEDLIDRVRARGDPDLFAERAGWDVRPALAEPATAWRDWSVDCLRDVCAEAGVDWTAVLIDPPDHLRV
jgi:transcriptional regulator with XRE-family HTH domain